MTFEEFVASLPSVEHPSYTPNLDGTQSSYPPCEVCGGTSFQLFDDGPSCLTCFKNDSDVETFVEAIDQALIRVKLLAALPLTAYSRQILERRTRVWSLDAELVAWRARSFDVGGKP